MFYTTCLNLAVSLIFLLEHELSFLTLSLPKTFFFILVFILIPNSSTNWVSQIRYSYRKTDATSHIAVRFCILLPIVNLDLSLVTYLFLSFDNKQVFGDLSSVMYKDSPFWHQDF